MDTLKTILNKMSNISLPQKKFLEMLFNTLMHLRGKATFRNLSRYSEYCERTYSRWFREEFDFTQFNQHSLEATIVPSGNILIAAIDCSFIKKSGKKLMG